MAILELEPFVSVTPRQRYQRGYDRCLVSRPVGLRVAKELGVKGLVDEQAVIVRLGKDVHVDLPFIKAFFGPIARKLGIDEFTKRWTIEGGMSYAGYRHCPLADAVANYLVNEKVRLEKAAAKRAKAASPGTWSEKRRWLIPEIGTEVRLCEGWTFRLFGESRNRDLTKALNVQAQLRRDRGSWSAPPKDMDCMVAAGAVMAVSRVYIRQGVKDYSSITFHLRKGAVVTADGQTITMKKGARFWAKLSDVNRIVCQVDLETLATN